MTDYQVYDDLDFDSEFENGKIFRIYFSSKLRKFRIISFDNKYVDELIDTFSDINPSSFFMKQYGYAVESKISIINKFGYFPTGFIFELLKYIKLKYGSLSYVQMSKDCLKYIDDFLRPLKKELNGKTFEISNISDDSGRNIERKNEGKNEYKFRDYQIKSIESLIFKGKGRGIIELPTSCHEKDHPILMYDGSIKKVQDVVVGDLLMGPDSKPRRVLETHSGIDDMYRIDTIDKLSFRVNSNHVLSLVRTHEKKKTRSHDGEINNISVSDYIKTRKWYKHIRKMYHVPVTFNNKYKLEIPPYILGILLGDGTLGSGVGLTNIDKEIVDEFYDYCSSIGMSVRKNMNDKKVPTYFCSSANIKNYNSLKHPNVLINKLNDLKLRNCKSGNKFIPQKYKTASEKDRLEILAGLIDTDGYVSNNKHDIEYISKSKTLAKDFMFIAQSLGFKATFSEKICRCQTGYTGLYYRVCLYGQFDKIPLRVKRKKIAASKRKQRTNKLRTGFKITKDKRDYFYGFSLDGDHLYLDGNFLVHHNSGKSFVISNFIYNIHKNINPEYTFLILVPNKQLVSQMYNDFIDYGMKPELITKFTAGLKKNEKYNPEAKIIIANRQYVFSNSDKLPKIDALFCDELHQCLAKATQEFINNLDCRIKVGCTGTIPKQKYNKWSLIGMMGNILYSEEITDLQKQGFITKLKITQINIKDMNVQNNRNYLFHLNPLRKYSPDEMGYSEIKFNEAHDAEHEYYAKYYKEIYTPVIKYLNDLDENILILFDRIEVGKRLTEVAKTLCDKKKIHYIDGSIDVKDRIKITEELENSGDNIIFAENAVFSTGINIKRLNHIVFMCSFKSFTRCIQSIGRILRLHSKKDYAHLIDVSCNYKYSRKHLNERLKIYQEVYHKKPDEIINITI